MELGAVAVTAVIKICINVKRGKNTMKGKGYLPLYLSVWTLLLVDSWVVGLEYYVVMLRSDDSIQLPFALSL